MKFIQKIKTNYRNLYALWVRKAKNSYCRANAEQENATYFKAARSWSDDIYLSSVVSRNRYQLAFFLTLGYSAILTVVLVVTFLSKQFFMIVVHQNPSGYNYVTLEKQHHAPKTSRAQIESDIVRYITARESYHPETYLNQSTLVTLLSDAAVKSEYQLSQSADNKVAPVHLLKNKGYRSVAINSILFLNNSSEETAAHGQPTHNLVQVNFTVTDHMLGHDQHRETSYAALMSWVYKGGSSNPEILWQNWSGFAVTSYQVHPVNILSM